MEGSVQMSTSVFLGHGEHSKSAEYMMHTLYHLFGFELNALYLMSDEEIGDAYHKLTRASNI